MLGALSRNFDASRSVVLHAGWFCFGLLLPQQADQDLFHFLSPVITRVCQYSEIMLRFPGRSQPARASFWSPLLSQQTPHLAPCRKMPEYKVLTNACTWML